MQKINKLSPSSSTENGTDKMNIFNIARVKKVELNDLPTLAKVGDESGKFRNVEYKFTVSIPLPAKIYFIFLLRKKNPISATTNEAQLMPTTILQQQQQQPIFLPISQDIQPTPSSILVQQQPLAPPVCSSTSQGNGNVLKKVASFTVERTNSDNTASKISRPSYVPEKLNFGAYEKFEGE